MEFTRKLTHLKLQIFGRKALLTICVWHLVSDSRQNLGREKKVALNMVDLIIDEICGSRGLDLKTAKITEIINISENAIKSTPTRTSNPFTASNETRTRKAGPINMRTDLITRSIIRFFTTK